MAPIYKGNALIHLCEFILSLLYLLKYDSPKCTPILVNRRVFPIVLLILEHFCIVD